MSKVSTLTFRGGSKSRTRTRTGPGGLKTGPGPAKGLKAGPDSGPDDFPDCSYVYNTYTL